MQNVPSQLFYDPRKTFDENIDEGPFFSNIPPLVREGEPKFSFLGFPLYLPFGIASGPLPTSKHIKAAFEWGYDVNHYKTMRTIKFESNAFPNVIPLEAEGKVTLEQAEKGFTMADDFPTDITKLVATNSFGNPGRGPDFWVPDMKKAVEAAGKGQLMIASAFGSLQDGMSEDEYWNDFAEAARLAVTAGAKVVEMNLSCPNLDQEGLICYTPRAVIGICERAKKLIGSTPLLVKLGYFTDAQQSLFEEMIDEVSPYIAGISVINTIPAKVFNKQGEQALPGEGRLKSGLVGAGIKWAGLEMVKRAHALRKEKNYNFEIIGVGGVVTPKDFVEYREAGADVVQACAGPMWNPDLAAEIKAALK